eukprot:scaffold303_cov46-Attheya_sp.AAC.6
MARGHNLTHERCRGGGTQEPRVRLESGAQGCFKTSMDSLILGTGTAKVTTRMASQFAIGVGPSENRNQGCGWKELLKGISKLQRIAQSDRYS